MKLEGGMSIFVMLCSRPRGGRKEGRKEAGKKYDVFAYCQFWNRVMEGAS